VKLTTVTKTSLSDDSKSNTSKDISGMYIYLHSTITSLRKKKRMSTTRDQ